MRIAVVFEVLTDAGKELQRKIAMIIVEHCP